MCCQTSTQSISAFVAHLKHLAQHFQFGTTFNDMLRDLVIVGVKQDQMCRRLLSEGILLPVLRTSLSQWSLQAKMLQMLLAPSLTNGELTCHLSIAWNNIQTENLTKTPGNCLMSGAGKCCFCLNGEHSPTTCRFKNTACNYCHKEGHIASACLSQKRRARREECKTHLLHSEHNQEDMIDGDSPNSYRVSVK